MSEILTFGSEDISCSAHPFSDQGLWVWIVQYGSSRACPSWKKYQTKNSLPINNLFPFQKQCNFFCLFLLFKSVLPLRNIIKATSRMERKSFSIAIRGLLRLGLFSSSQISDFKISILQYENCNIFLFLNFGFNLYLRSV